MPIKSPLLVRFNQKVDRSDADGCHLWIGATVQGHGVIWYKGKHLRATHAAWHFKHGQWPTKYIAHTCDNPLCVRPDHLFEGRRHVSDGWNLGSQHGRAKLNEQRVLAIRECYAQGGVTMQELAIEHGVAESRISEVINRKTWTHI